MQRHYQDIAGNVIKIKPITMRTMKEARAKGLDWMTDLDRVGVALQDYERLGEAVAHCSGCDLDTILEGLAGDAIEKAQEAFFETLADFYPSRIGRALRQQIRRVPEEIDKAIQIAMEQVSSSQPLSDGSPGNTASEISIEQPEQ